MDNCKFCEGKAIKAEYVGSGIKTMNMMLGMLMGREEREGTECENGIQLQNGNQLVFDNSAREYAELAIEIEFCPFCGRKLKAND